MKKLLCSLAVLMSFFSFSARAETSGYDRVMAKNEIVCGVWSWPPYKELDPNTKEWKGFIIDIFRKAFATLDIKVVFKEVVLGNQVQDLNSGRVDAICDDGPYTMSAGKFVEFSDPLYASIVYPYVRQDETRFKTRADLNNEKVHFTGIDGDVSSDLVPRLFPKAKLATMPTMTEVSQLYMDLMTKKVDVVLADPVSFAVFEKTNPGKLRPLFKNKPLGHYKEGISVKKGDMKLLGLVNQAIDNALAFGLVDEALDALDPKHEQLMRVRSRYVFSN